MNCYYPVIDVGDCGIRITRLGMGCWATGGHGWGNVDNKDSHLAVRKVLECGVNFFDTADVYGLGKSEELLAKFLSADRHSVVIATKGGVRVENGKTKKDCSPAYLRQAVEGSLKRLQLNTIPIYYVHWPDDITPIPSMMEGLVRLREEGKIQAIGLSNFSLEQILEANRIGTVDIVQGQWNLLYPESGNKIVEICKENQIVFVAYGVLADGLLTGKYTERTNFFDDDHRSRSPHFQGKEFEDNLKCIGELTNFIDDKELCLSQLSLRWVLDKGMNTCALFGAKDSDQVSQNVGAFQFQLSADDLRVIDLLAAKRQF